jgi:hypothetical protein
VLWCKILLDNVDSDLVHSQFGETTERLQGITRHVTFLLQELEYSLESPIVLLLYHDLRLRIDLNLLS